MPAARHSRSFVDLPALPLIEGERKQQWVYRQLAKAIQNGLLLPGDSVPSTRVLAMRWGVSRGVVELAFEQLIQEGYLQAEVGKGTQVHHELPDRFVRVDSPGRSGHATDNSTFISVEPPCNPVNAGEAFIARLPDVGLFDLVEWRKSVARAAQHLEVGNMAAADPRGIMVLREEVRRHLALSRGVQCTVDDIMIVTGIRHALDLCSQIALDLGAVAAVESPGYAGAHAIFKSRGLTAVDIPVDTDGMDVVQLQKSRASFVYVTPAHQAPTGVAMSSQRRLDLLDWAQEKKAWIFEDDYDSDFNYESAPMPALKSQDADGRVIFCGSFNKSLFPSLRIGYVVAPATWMARLINVRAATGRSNAVLDQLALTDFISSGALLKHLKKARVSYKQRRDWIIQEMQAAGLESCALQGQHAGFHFVLRLPPGSQEAEVVTKAAEAGLAVQGLSAFCHGVANTSGPALVIGYAALSDAQAKWHARTLAQVLLAYCRTEVMKST